MGNRSRGRVVTLRSESTAATLTARTKSGADGRYEVFAVREGAQTLIAIAVVSGPRRGAIRRSRYVNHNADLLLTRGERRGVDGATRPSPEQRGHLLRRS